MKKYVSLSFLIAVAISLSACTSPDSSLSAPQEEKTMSEKYEGLTVEVAQSMAAEKDVPFRVVMQDGESFPVTMDYLPGRINAMVENGLVVSVDIEGMENLVPEEETETDVMTYDSESWNNIIPEDCSSYFDGCNNCQKDPGSEMAACTRMFCEEYQEPKCLDEEASDTEEK